MTEEIPQIIAVVSVSSDGKLNLRKDVREYLEMKGTRTLFLDMQDEVILSTQKGGGQEVAVVKGNRISLPEKALMKLGIAHKSLVGFLQRRNAVAIKKVEVAEREGERARIVDLETTYKITRMAETNPMPEKLLPKLEEQYKGFKLRYDVEDFLKGRRTFEAWKARKILGIVEPSDEELRRELIGKRLKEQREDGSWEGRVTVTARNLRELAELGMRADADEMRRAIDWLMRRSQSSQNPGMFFVADELVREQEDLIRRREEQTGEGKGRLRERPGSEIRLARSEDDLIGRPPCGLRMMWPTALVLEALSKLDYEENERTQAALCTLMSDKWCEAHRLHAHQHASCGLKRREPYSMEDMQEIEKDCIEQFRYGGIGCLRELETKDLAHKSGEKMPRIGHKVADEVHEYPLRLPIHLQGCELRITRALSQTRNEKMRRLGEAHLWRFAGRQHSTDGRFVEKGHEKYLAIFASYDCPVSKVVIMRSIPWILRNQNEDGSWGDEPNNDSSTLAVMSALENIGFI